MNYWLAIIPLIISTISLYFSIRANLRQVPYIKIKILDSFPSACYGGTKVSKIGQPTSYAALVNIRLYNKSLTPVSISEIKLKMGNESYELASKDIDYWKEIIFYYIFKEECTYNGSFCDYKSLGITIPFVLKGYETRDFMCVFMDFPNIDKPIVNAKLEIDSGVGKKIKKLKLNLYDEQYTHKEWKEFEKFDKSR